MKSVYRFCTTLIICLYTLTVTHAQFYNQLPGYLKGNSMWTFGRWSGLNFNNYAGGAPTPFRVSLFSDEGCASVADRVTGRLLFYSNGISCWNRNNIVMPNGSGLLGWAWYYGQSTLRGSSTAQSSCIVPFVDDPDKYYLFCLSSDGAYDQTGYLTYSVVDMSLNNGMGDIVAGSKNIALDSGLSEAMIAIPGNNCDVWLMVHTYDDPQFKAYHITAAGVDHNPVISATGGQIAGREAYYIGQLAVSPSREMIAMTSYHYHYENFDPYGTYYPQPPGLSLIGALVCRFDPQTGIVSDAIQIEDKKNCYGVVFSPDNTKLYTNIYHDPAIRSGQIMQYDIGTFDSAAIARSRQEIYRGGKTAIISFKQYRDTVYLACQDFGSFMHRINNPNASGPACDYQARAFSLQSGTSQIFQLNNDVVYPFPADTVYRRMDTTLCDNQTELFLQAPPGYSFYQWDDLSSGDSRMITGTGTYWVAYRNSCNLYMDTFAVHLPDTSYYTADSVLCAGSPGFLLHAVGGYDHYIWDDGTADTIRHADDPGIYWVRSGSYCHTRLDTFYVRGTDIRFSLGADTVICDQVPLYLNPLIADAGGIYLWQDGSRDTAYMVTESGEYALMVHKDICSYADTIRVQYIDIRQDLGNDTVICREQPVAILLEAKAGPLSDVLWSDGSKEAAIIVSGAGRYSVRVSEDRCRDSAAVIVREALCNCVAEMPTAFSPNGDGKNDRFRPVIEAGCQVRGFILEIYNRWGQLMYTGTDISAGWDGTCRGEPAPVGAYFYTVRMHTGTEDNLYYKKGDFTLVR